MHSTISPKVTASALAAAVLSVLVWLLQEFADVTLPVEVQGALMIIGVFVAGYLARDPKRVTEV